MAERALGSLPMGALQLLGYDPFRPAYTVRLGG